MSSLNNGNRRTGWGDKAQFLKVPVLCQVFTEGIGVEKHANGGCYRLLCSQFLGTAGSIVGNVSAQGVLVAYHAIERAAGADRFLLSQFFVRNGILAVQFLPGTHHVDVVERLSYPILVMLGKVEGRFAT